MSGLNWKRANDRQRMREQGVEAARGDEKLPFELPSGRRWRKRTSKADLRAQANAAVAEFLRRKEGKS
jgi:hypothetical protein